MLAAARKLHFTNTCLCISALSGPTEAHHHSQEQTLPRSRSTSVTPESLMHACGLMKLYIHEKLVMDTSLCMVKSTGFSLLVKKKPPRLKCQLCKSPDKSLSKCKVSGKKIFPFFLTQQQLFLFMLVRI